MDRLPLLFSFKNTISGEGFQAHVIIQGRALVERGVEEEGEVWLTGVQPGGIAEGAKDMEEAYEKFKAGFREVLLDIADGAENFNVFELRVGEFLREVCTESEKMWWQAVRTVRARGYTEESLEKKPADTPVDVTIERVERLMLEQRTAPEEPEQEYDLAA